MSPNDAFDAFRELSPAPDEVVEARLERRRYGKEVTIVAGFAARRDLRPIARHLKQRLAVGGAAKDGQVELQGDQLGRIGAALAELGIRFRIGGT